MMKKELTTNEEERVKRVLQSQMHFYKIESVWFIAESPSFFHCGKPMFIIGFDYTKEGSKYRGDVQFTCSDDDCSIFFTSRYKTCCKGKGYLSLGPSNRFYHFRRPEDYTPSRKYGFFEIIRNHFNEILIGD